MNSKFCRYDLESSISAKNYESWILASVTHMFEYTLIVQWAILFIFEGSYDDQSH